MIVILKMVRLRHANLFVPKAYKDEADSKLNYSATLILAPVSEELKAVNAAIQQVAKDTWPKDWQQVLKTMQARDLTCVHDGDLKANIDGYAGNYFINASNTARPTLKDQFKQLVTEDTGLFYTGCYVSASIDVYASKKYNKICAQLRGLMFYDHGEPFESGGNVATDEEFANITPPAAVTADTDFVDDIPY